eukprot:scaffold6683_cov58-Phaeocystis_antarctica.AAC.4
MVGKRSLNWQPTGQRRGSTTKPPSTRDRACGGTGVHPSCCPWFVWSRRPSSPLRHGEPGGAMMCTDAELVARACGACRNSPSRMSTSRPPVLGPSTTLPSSWCSLARSS